METTLPGWYLPHVAVRSQWGLYLVKKLLPQQPECDLSKLLEMKIEGFRFVQDGQSLRESGPGVAPYWVGVEYQGQCKIKDGLGPTGTLFIATAYLLKLCVSEPNVERFRNEEQKRIQAGLETVIGLYKR